jgi:hypothetical protein
MLKLTSALSGIAVSSTSIAVGSEGTTQNQAPYFPDIVLANSDTVEHRVKIVAHAAPEGTPTEPIFRTTRTVAPDSQEIIETVFPRGEPSHVRATLDDGRIQTRTSRALGNFPLRYGLEVHAKPDVFLIYERHVDVQDDGGGR